MMVMKAAGVQDQYIPYTKCMKWKHNRKVIFVCSYISSKTTSQIFF